MSASGCTKSKSVKRKFKDQDDTGLAPDADAADASAAAAEACPSLLSRRLGVRIVVVVVAVVVVIEANRVAPIQAQRSVRSGVALAEGAAAVAGAAHAPAPARRFVLFV